MQPALEIEKQINWIRSSFNNNIFKISAHASDRMVQRAISLADILNTVKTGEAHKGICTSETANYRFVGSKAQVIVGMCQDYNQQRDPTVVTVLFKDEPLDLPQDQKYRTIRVQYCVNNVLEYELIDNDLEAGKLRRVDVPEAISSKLKPGCSYKILMEKRNGFWGPTDDISELDKKLESALELKLGAIVPSLLKAPEKAPTKSIDEMSVQELEEYLRIKKAKAEVEAQNRIRAQYDKACADLVALEAQVQVAREAKLELGRKLGINRPEPAKLGEWAERVHPTKATSQAVERTIAKYAFNEKHRWDKILENPIVKIGKDGTEGINFLQTGKKHGLTNYELNKLTTYYKLTKGKNETST